MYHVPGGYRRPYGEYGDLTVKLLASNPKKNSLSLAWPSINGLYMANVDRLFCGLLWVYPDVIIQCIILRSNLRVHNVYILWGCKNNINVILVLELWVSEVGVWDKKSD